LVKYFRLEVSLNLRSQVNDRNASNNHAYKDLVEYFRSEVSLNLRSQVNNQNALNNHAYEDLVEYFRLEVSLNLGSQVNVRNASNNYPNALRVPSQILVSQLIPNYSYYGVNLPKEV